MKKSLTKLLARMAKDGDVETVAEFIEEMIGEEETPLEAAAEAVEAVAETAAEEPVTVEVPENREITIDEESVSGIIERLDRLIALLAPPVADEDPESLPEEVAEVVEEVMEAVEASEETDPEAAEEVSAIVEEILQPVVSSTLEETAEEEDENSCGTDPDRAKDALRSALSGVRPALAAMSAAQRKQVCAGIADRFYGRPAKDSGIYAALASAVKSRRNPMDLGKRIMQSRNPHYRK